MPQNTLPRAESPHEGPSSPLLRAWEAAKFDLVFAKLGTLILAPTGLCTASTPAMRSEVAMSTSGSATLLCASHVHPEMQTKGAQSCMKPTANELSLPTSLTTRCPRTPMYLVGSSEGGLSRDPIKDLSV